MTQIVPSLATIANRYDALFCDLWGCLHNGHAPYPAAVAALRSFRAGGGRVVLLTNAPRPARFVIATLDRMGVPRDAWDLVVSSGDAAQFAMLHGAVGHRVWHLGPAKDDGFFTDYPPEFAGDHIERVDLHQAQGIVCTGPFDELTEVPEDYRDRLLDAKARGLKLLCANPDLVVDMGERRIYCAGALAALYTEIGGESLYFGKPHPPIYDLARRELAALTGSEPEAGRILAIGDGIATDVLGAAGQGIDALFVSGGLAARDLGPDPEHPAPAALDDWLARHQMSPAFTIGRLR